ncbi:hypothetical protein ACFQU2_16705 [Siccirubricoccus deserti]
MQEDASAFEGWALVLVAWCGVGRVLIDWDVPDSAALDSDPGHYQRFLYRVHRFAHLLGPDRVGVCRRTGCRCCASAWGNRPCSPSRASPA